MCSSGCRVVIDMFCTMLDWFHSCTEYILRTSHPHPHPHTASITNGPWSCHHYTIQHQTHNPKKKYNDTTPIIHQPIHASDPNQSPSTPSHRKEGSSPLIRRHPTNPLRCRAFHGSKNKALVIAGLTNGSQRPTNDLPRAMTWPCNLRALRVNGVFKV